MNIPKFCRTCGKQTVTHTFYGQEFFSEQTGKKLRKVEKIVVCPDHKSDHFKSGHTRYTLNERTMDAE